MTIGLRPAGASRTRWFEPARVQIADNALLPLATELVSAFSLWD